jgi:hypothetical protein
LREVQRELQARGCTVLVVAPQRQQVMGLEKDGLENVETVSALLARRQMPFNAVVLVDEAGQIGGKQMHALLRMVKEHRGRVILSGDSGFDGCPKARCAFLYAGFGAGI